MKEKIRKGKLKFEIETDTFPDTINVSPESIGYLREQLELDENANEYDGMQIVIDGEIIVGAIALSLGVASERKLDYMEMILI